ncbi:UNVERIFIED_CONTAM: hypothetical protein FKN15_033833 [Acipenser sinensis]
MKSSLNIGMRNGKPLWIWKTVACCRIAVSCKSFYHMTPHSRLPLHMLLLSLTLQPQKPPLSFYFQNTHIYLRF